MGFSFNELAKRYIDLGIKKYIGFSTLYNQINILKRNREKYKIRKGVVLQLFSTNINYLYIMEFEDKKLTDWRSYQNKPIKFQDIQESENNEIKELLNHTEKELLEKLKVKKPLGITTSIIKIYNRNPYVIAYSLKKANGICKLCEQKSPFKTNNNTDYLEVHHIISLSENGTDCIENAAAVCPNCHRELHYGVNKNDLKTKLLKIKKGC